MPYCYCWLYSHTPHCPLHKYQHMLCHIAIVDCTHLHHIAHYTNTSTCYAILLLLTAPTYTTLPTTQIPAHAIPYCYCWLYSHTPHCPLHKYQHMLCHIAIADCTHIHHIAHYTNTSTCYAILLLLTVLTYTTLPTTQIPAHAMPYCYCWLYSHTPHCPLHKYQHMLYHIAIADCTHIHHIAHYTNTSTCYAILLLLTVLTYTTLPTTQIPAHAMPYCYCWLYSHTPHCPLHKYQHMLYHIAIADCTHIHHIAHYTNTSTCYAILLLLTAPTYTTLPTTQIPAHAMPYCYCWLHPHTPHCPLHKYQHMLCHIAIVDCTHIHHIAHYTNTSTCYAILLLLTAPIYTTLPTTQIPAHAMPYCYCWLHPHTPHCLLHKYQHMLCHIAIVDCTHIHHIAHYTNTSTCYAILLLLTAPTYTTLPTTQIPAHAMPYCYCWLHPHTPHCPLHKYLYMLCHIAIVDCTHIHHIAHYTNTSTCYAILLLLTVPTYTTLPTTQIPTHAMPYCYCWLHPHTPHCPLHIYQHMLCHIAIVDCTHTHHIAHYTNTSTCYAILLLLTVPTYTTLPTTQIPAHAMPYCYCWLHPHTPHCPLHKYQHMLCHIAIVDCTHIHHIAHYTYTSTCYAILLLLTAPIHTTLPTTQIPAHAMPYCYCWLYPHTPHCPLHKYQHMLCHIAIVDCTHIHHIAHYTNTSTCYAILLLLTAPTYTTLPTTQIPAHAMPYCYCWLYPHIPHCPLHKYLHMLCHIAIVDCTHIHHIAHYTNTCTCYAILLLLTVPTYTTLPTTQIPAYAMPYCYCWLYPHTPHCPLHKYQHMLWLVAILSCTNVGSARASFKDLATVIKSEKSKNQTAKLSALFFPTPAGAVFTLILACLLLWWFLPLHNLVVNSNKLIISTTNGLVYLVWGVSLLVNCYQVQMESTADFCSPMQSLKEAVADTTEVVNNSNKIWYVLIIL